VQQLPVTENKRAGAQADRLSYSAFFFALCLATLQSPLVDLDLQYLRLVQSKSYIMEAKCNACKKGQPEVSLMECSKCSTTLYCSQECQKADWNTHKQTCGKTNQSTNATARLSPPKGLDQPISMPFTRLENGTWLHDRPEIDVYRLLVDAYRLRVEDTYVMEGDLMEGSIYAGNTDGLRGFRDFLRKAATVSGLLPPWWNNEKKAACEQLGMDTSQWSDLRCAVQKHNIIEQYGDPQFPIQLRMLAEAVYRRGLDGKDLTAVRATMVARESGELGADVRTTVIDLTTM
jgi:splicing suppressor protein 51